MELASERLIYSFTIPEEIQMYLDLVSNEKVMEFITARPLSIEEGKKKFDKIIEINESEIDIGVYSVYTKNQKEFVGIAKVVPFEENVYEIGYSIYPKFWGVHFGTEVSKKMVEIGKNLINARALIAIIDPNNIASRKILEKSNFEHYKMGQVYDIPAEFLKLNLEKNEL